VRGDIYRLRTSRTRYAVVIQSDHLLLSTVLVAPRVIMDGTTTYVLAEQTAAVNAETRLGDLAGRLDPTELADLDRALTLVFGLY
jgi:mRNA interferase MazF